MLIRILHLHIIMRALPKELLNPKKLRKCSHCDSAAIHQRI